MKMTKGEEKAYQDGQTNLAFGLLAYLRPYLPQAQNEIISWRNERRQVVDKLREISEIIDGPEFDDDFNLGDILEKSIIPFVRIDAERLKAAAELIDGPADVTDGNNPPETAKVCPFCKSPDCLGILVTK